MRIQDFVQAVRVYFIRMANYNPCKPKQSANVYIWIFLRWDSGCTGVGDGGGGEFTISDRNFKMLSKLWGDMAF